MKTQKKSIVRDTRHFSALVHKIYEAGVQPERWNQVVADIAASFGSNKGLLFTPYVAPQHGGMIFPAGISEATLQLWGSSYIDHDIWALSMQAKGLWSDGAVWLDDQMVPRDEFLASRFYREFLSTIGIGRVCLGLVFDGAPGLPPTSLSIFRDTHEPAFDEADSEWMQLLVSHVSRALGVMQRLDTAHLQKTSLLASFDRLGFGVVLLNENMQVLHLNQSAQTVMDRHDGILVDSGRRLASTGSGSAGSQELSQWLTLLKNTPETEQMHFLDGCQVLRKNGQSHYVIQCSPIATEGRWTAQEEEIRYAAFVFDPAVLQLPSVDRLTKLYGLTETQAKVALAFAGGGTYRQVADNLRISEETVRSHVKEIYPKTKVNRQADLVRLILSLGQCAV